MCPGPSVGYQSPADPTHFDESIVSRHSLAVNARFGDEHDELCIEVHNTRKFCEQRIVYGGLVIVEANARYGSRHRDKKTGGEFPTNVICVFFHELEVPR